MKEVTKFLWSRTYILQKKGERTYFFSMVERHNDDITFELRDKNNRKQVSGMAFVPADEQREVFGFKWSDKTEFLVADYYIPRGLKGRTTEDGKHEVLVGDKWVEYGKHHEAIKLLDEKYQ